VQSASTELEKALNRNGPTGTVNNNWRCWSSTPHGQHDYRATATPNIVCNSRKMGANSCLTDSLAGTYDL
jgi:hypothetical protein